MALECLSAVLGTESRDLKLWLGRSGAVELENMLSLIFSEIGPLFSDPVSLDALDMIQQTYCILSRTRPAELNIEPMYFTDSQCEVILDPVCGLTLHIRYVASHESRIQDPLAHVSEEPVVLGRSI